MSGRIGRSPPRSLIDRLAHSLESPIFSAKSRFVKIRLDEWRVGRRQILLSARRTVGAAAPRRRQLPGARRDPPGRDALTGEDGLLAALAQALPRRPSADLRAALAQGAEGVRPKPTIP
jgi:hypothetical protein